MTIPISIETPGIHHIGLRVSDYARAKIFYTVTLGFPVLVELPNLIIFAAGLTGVAIRGPAAQTREGDRFDPFRVGLDHIALGCVDEAELVRVAEALTDAGVDNTGVRVDDALGKKYVAFKDPDRIAWELYMV
jgi:catechol 2,3-dioxygenase-like lactoylglutathione lyase family enzyme